MFGPLWERVQEWIEDWFDSRWWRFYGWRYAAWALFWSSRFFLGTACLLNVGSGEFQIGFWVLVIGWAFVACYNTYRAYEDEGVPPPWDFEGWIEYRRIRRGLCPKCGYDLRASGARCPECGADSPFA